MQLGTALVVIMALPLAAASGARVGTCTQSNFLTTCTGSPCVSGRCLCDAGWIGRSCGKAKLGEAVHAFQSNHTWLWGSATVRDKNSGLYHTFTMAQKLRCGTWHYRHNSEIIHGVSSNSLGPFASLGVSLDNRSGSFFDAVEVEDPSVIALPNAAGFLLYYAGATYPEGTSHRSGPIHLNSEHDVSPDPDSAVLAAGQRIGVAFAPSLGDGTAPVLWRRLPSPILSVRTLSWDSVRVCNPAPLVLPNGTSTLLRDRTAPPYLLGYAANDGDGASVP